MVKTFLRLMNVSRPQRTWRQVTSEDAQVSSKDQADSCNNRIALSLDTSGLMDDNPANCRLLKNSNRTTVGAVCDRAYFVELTRNGRSAKRKRDSAQQ